MPKESVPPVRNDAPGMRGPRARTESGPLRQVRSDKLVGTIERQYNVDFGVRSDMKLGTLRSIVGSSDMKSLLKHK